VNFVLSKILFQYSQVRLQRVGDVLESIFIWTQDTGIRYSGLLRSAVTMSTTVSGDRSLTRRMEESEDRSMLETVGRAWKVTIIRS
jgi:hypothetical protein